MQNKKMKIAVLMVTYGDRLNILKKTVPHLLKLDLEFILVQNEVSENVNSFIKTLQIDYPNLHVISSKINKGSAGGYHLGLHFFINNLSNINKVLLLDDDNFIEKDMIQEIKKLRLENQVYLCNRIDRNTPNSKNCSSNNFLGTNIFHKATKDINCAPYGGLLLPRNIINIVGYPKSKLFLYGDDHEYTYRITQQGFKINFLDFITIKDLIYSHDRSNKKHRYFQNNLHQDLLYFQIRNHTSLSYFQKTSNLIFYTNFLIVIISLVYNNIKTKSFNYNRWKIIIKAIVDGRKNKL